jgi:hypothetical protein
MIFDDLNLDEDEILGGNKKYIQINLYEYEGEDPSYEIKYIYSSDENVNLYFYSVVDPRNSFFFLLLENNVIEIGKIYDMNDNYFNYRINEHKKRIKLEDFRGFVNHYHILIGYNSVIEEEEIEGSRIVRYNDIIKNHTEQRIKELFYCDCIIDNYIYGKMNIMEGGKYVDVTSDFFVRINNEVHFLENQNIHLILTNGKYLLEV